MGNPRGCIDPPHFFRISAGPESEWAKGVLSSREERIGEKRKNMDTRRPEGAEIRVEEGRSGKGWLAVGDEAESAAGRGPFQDGPDATRAAAALFQRWSGSSVRAAESTPRAERNLTCTQQERTMDSSGETAQSNHQPRWAELPGTVPGPGAFSEGAIVAGRSGDQDGGSTPSVAHALVGDAVMPPGAVPESGATVPRERHAAPGSGLPPAASGRSIVFDRDVVPLSVAVVSATWIPASEWLSVTILAPAEVESPNGEARGAGREPRGAGMDLYLVGGLESPWGDPQQWSATGTPEQGMIVAFDKSSAEPPKAAPEPPAK